MSTIIEGLIGFFELFKPYLEEIKANWYLFLIWTLAWLAVFAAISALINKYIRKQFEKQIKAKNEEIARLQSEIAQLKKDYDALNAYTWLGAANIPPNGKNAAAVAIQTQEKYKVDGD